MKWTRNRRFDKVKKNKKNSCTETNDFVKKKKTSHKSVQWLRVSLEIAARFNNIIVENGKRIHYSDSYPNVIWGEIMNDRLSSDTKRVRKSIRTKIPADKPIVTGERIII